MRLTLCLTHNCNLKCNYCYAGSKIPISMSYEISKKAIDWGLQNYTKNLEIGYFGGEPLLEWNLIKNIVSYIENESIKYNVSIVHFLTTNGILLDEKKLDWLLKHKFILAISVDGSEKMHNLLRLLPNGKGSFNECIIKLRLAISIFKTLTVVIVVDPFNVKFLADGVSYLVEYENVKKIKLSINYSGNWNSKHCYEFQTQIKKIGNLVIRKYKLNNPFYINVIHDKIFTHIYEGYKKCDLCGFGTSEIAIAPSGDIFPCERLIKYNDHKEMIIGNVEQGINKKLRNALQLKLSKQNEDCKICTYRFRCCSWCASSNYFRTGKINEPDGFICFIEQGIINEADRVGAFLYNLKNKIFINEFYN